jgi:hypothetical protein
VIAALATLPLAVAANAVPASVSGTIAAITSKPMYAHIAAWASNRVPVQRDRV